MSTRFYRKVLEAVFSQEQSEGAGARVRRSIGSARLRNFDPFLMLDVGQVQLPAGFPDHPHRGFETVTYVLPWSKGSIDHEDVCGHAGRVSPGGLQWMTAGRGIAHSEVPAPGEPCEFLQLWINLSGKSRNGVPVSRVEDSDKMCEPRYQEKTAAEISQVTNADGVNARVIAGTALGVTAPTQTLTPSTYIHFTVPKGVSFEHDVPANHRAFIFLLRGKLEVDGKGPYEENHTLTLDGPAGAAEGEMTGLKLKAVDGEASFVVISGRPHGEPIVQHGPFVMNTQDEIREAFFDYQGGKNGFEGANSFRSEIGKQVRRY